MRFYGGLKFPVPLTITVPIQPSRMALNNSTPPRILRKFITFREILLMDSKKARPKANQSHKLCFVDVITEGYTGKQKDVTCLSEPLIWDSDEKSLQKVERMAFLLCTGIQHTHKVVLQCDIESAFEGQCML